MNESIYIHISVYVCVYIYTYVHIRFMYVYAYVDIHMYCICTYLAAATSHVPGSQARDRHRWFSQHRQPPTAEEIFGCQPRPLEGGDIMACYTSPPKFPLVQGYGGP